MSSVDDRAVNMHFNYKEFAAGIKNSLTSLEGLKKGLKLDGATKGLHDLGKASKGVSLEGLSSQLNGIQGKFSAMSVAGIAAFGTLVSQATMAGTNIAKSLTIAPISGGLSEYEKKLSSIQTILSNTAAAGTNLEDVNGVLNELNEYSDKTIYNFGEMARNIGTFTAAGVELDTAVGSIKGIANLAALSGSSSEQASTAMYQLSQAISAGKVSLMDWNSVVNAGMGGSVFQRALAETAVAMGKLEAGAVKLDGPMKNVKINGQAFRESISAEGGGPTWLTSDVLTTALQNFTGDMKEADLVAQGFSKSQAKAIMDQAKMASEAATVVKTGSQLMGTLKESAESGWATTWELIIGDFEEAKDLWTGVNNVFGGIINSSAEARNNVIRDWKKAGGRLAAIEAIKNIWEAFTRILTAVRQAFREVFPATSGKNLAELTKRFAKFTESLKVGSDNFQRIKGIAEGVFSIFRIGQLILIAAAKALGRVFGAAQQGSGGLLQIGATVGEFVRGIHDLLTQTGALDKFFDALFSPLKLLGPIMSFFTNISGAIGMLVNEDMAGFSAKMEAAFGSIGGLFSVLGNTLSSNLGKIGAIFTTIGEAITGSGDAAGNKFADMLTRVGAALTALKDSLNVGNIFSGLGGSMDGAAASAGKLSVVGEKLSGIWRGFKEAISGLTGATSGAGSGLAELFESIITRVTDFIRNFDFQEVVALINTGFFIALYITMRRFVKNLSELTGKFGDMIDGITGTFDQLTSTLKTMQSSVRATMILKIAIAVGILAFAVKTLSEIESGALKKALTGLAAIFVQVGIVLAVLTKYNPASFFSAATGLVMMAFAIKILTGAIENLGKMDQDVLIQGSVSLGILMAALSAMVLVLNKLVGIPAAAAGLLLLSLALTALLVPIKIFSKMKWSTLAKGLSMMAITVAALGLSLRAMGKNPIKNAAALVIMAGAITVLAGVITLLGTLDLWTIVKGLGAMAIAMTILVVAANAMIGAMPGALATLAMAGAITILSVALKLLGGMDLWSIIKGLIALAGVFLVIGLASVILAPLTPVIATLALALYAMGKALFLVGAGMALFAAGLALLAVSGAAGFAVLITGFTAFLNLLPLLAQQFGHAVIAFAVVIREGAPKIIQALFALLTSFLDELNKFIPKVGVVMITLVRTLIKVLVTLAPELIQAGIEIFVKLIEGMARNIYRIAKVVADFAKKFLDALDKQQPGIIRRGIESIIKFIDALAVAITLNQDRLGEAGAKLGVALAKGLGKGLLSMHKYVAIEAAKLMGKAIDAAKKKLNINSPSKVFENIGHSVGEGMTNGVFSSTGTVVGATETMGDQAINAMRHSLANIARVVDESIDSTPVIRPVLDLSAVQSGAGGIGSMFNGQSVSVGGTYGQASRASAGYNANKEAVNAQNGSDFAEAFSGGMTFNQYNTSPKALSTAEIYRNTKNQLSVAKKGALTVTP